MSDEVFSLEHPCGLTIRPELCESDLAARSDLDRHDMRTGYVWYRLPLAEIAGRCITTQLCFYQGALEAISLGVVNAELYGGAWSDWSEEKEQRRARDTGTWLAELGFPVGQYPWGIVYAEYDPKGGSGGGGVRFTAFGVR